MASRIPAPSSRRHSPPKILINEETWTPAAHGRALAQPLPRGRTSVPSRMPPPGLGAGSRRFSHSRTETSGINVPAADPVGLPPTRGATRPEARRPTGILRPSYARAEAVVPSRVQGPSRLQESSSLRRRTSLPGRGAQVADTRAFEPAPRAPPAASLRPPSHARTTASRTTEDVPVGAEARRTSMPGTRTKVATRTSELAPRPETRRYSATAVPSRRTETVARHVQPPDGTTTTVTRRTSLSRPTPHTRVKTTSVVKETVEELPRTAAAGTGLGGVRPLAAPTGAVPKTRLSDRGPGAIPKRRFILKPRLVEKPLTAEEEEDKRINCLRESYKQMEAAQRSPTRPPEGVPPHLPPARQRPPIPRTGTIHPSKPSARPKRTATPPPIAPTAPPEMYHQRSPPKMPTPPKFATPSPRVATPPPRVATPPRTPHRVTTPVRAASPATRGSLVVEAVSEGASDTGSEAAALPEEIPDLDLEVPEGEVDSMAVQFGYGVDDPHGAESASNLSMAEAEVLFSILYATLGCRIRVYEFFLYKDRTRHTGADLVSTSAERRPVLYSPREVALNKLSMAHRWLLSFQSVARSIVTDIKYHREGTRFGPGSYPKFDRRYVPALNRRDMIICHNLWNHTLQNLYILRQDLQIYVGEAVREEVSYCYSLIDEMDRKIQHQTNKNEPVDQKWRVLMKDWATYLRLVQLMAEYGRRCLRLDCVYDVCDAFRLVCQRDCLGPFMRKTAPALVMVLDQHDAFRTRSYRWATEYQENNYRWDHERNPIWSPKLLLPVLASMCTREAPRELSIYCLARHSPVYAAKYVFGKKWRKVLLEIISRSKVADKMVMFHSHLGKLITAIKQIESGVAELERNEGGMSHTKLERIGAKYLFEYWQESSRLQDNTFKGLKVVMSELLREEYQNARLRNDAIVNNFLQEYVSALSAKHRDLPHLIEGDHFKMYKQIMYIYVDMLKELVMAISCVNSNSIWLLETPSRGPIYLKACCDEIIQKVKNLPSGGRQAKDCVPQFIAHRLPMPTWARIQINDKVREEAEKRNAIHLAKLTEEVRLYNMKKKPKFHHTVDMRLKYKPYEKEPDRPDDMPEDPQPWQTRNQDTGLHFWVEPLLNFWSVAEPGDRHWETAAGRLQGNYVLRDMPEKEFTEMLAYSWQGQLLQGGVLGRVGELEVLEDFMSQTDLREEAIMEDELEGYENVEDYREWYEWRFPRAVYPL